MLFSLLSAYLSSPFGHRGRLERVSRGPVIFHLAVIPWQSEIETAMAKFAVREGTREDCGELRRLIQELANFEKFPDEPRLSTEDLQRDGFDFEPPLFQTYVAESEENPGVLVGYIFYHYTYSTWYGRKMHLRDIYVTESYRKTGLGNALIRKLIEKAVDMDCWSIDFNVVGWNPARHFYFKFGAKDMTQDEEFRLFRMHWAEMQAFVSKE